MDAVPFSTADLLNDFDKALLGHVEAVSRSCPIDVNWPDRDYTIKSGTPYLRPRTSGRSRVPAGFGGNTSYNWTGSFTVACLVPFDMLSTEKNRIAGHVADAFFRGLVFPVAKRQARLTILSSNPQGEVPSGVWGNIPVVVQWSCNEPGQQRGV